MKTTKSYHENVKSYKTTWVGLSLNSTISTPLLVNFDKQAEQHWALNGVQFIGEQ